MIREERGAGGPIERARTVLLKSLAVKFGGQVIPSGSQDGNVAAQRGESNLRRGDNPRQLDPLADQTLGKCQFLPKLGAEQADDRANSSSVTTNRTVLRQSPPGIRQCDMNRLARHEQFGVDREIRNFLMGSPEIDRRRRPDTVGRANAGPSGTSPKERPSDPPRQLIDDFLGRQHVRPQSLLEGWTQFLWVVSTARRALLLISTKIKNRDPSAAATRKFDFFSLSR
jgi:hypothetical protein